MKKVFILAVIAGMVVCLAACTPSGEDLQQKYRENDFVVHALDESDLMTLDLECDRDDIAYAFKAKKDKDNEATVISFADGQNASEFYNRQYAVKKDMDLVKIGNTVIFGSKEAVSLAKNK